jgi:hypothetical protein
MALEEQKIQLLRPRAYLPGTAKPNNVQQKSV